jgi:LPS export ABC transporter protein LptC
MIGCSPGAMRQSGGVSAIAAVRVIAVTLWWCASTFASGPRLITALAAESPFSPFVDIQGTRLAGADDAGRRQWELQAQSLQLDRDRSLVVLIGVTGWLFHNGKQQVHLVAPRATYASKSNTVELEGGVVGTVVDGRKLEADTIRWVAGTRLTASGRIVLVQPGLTIRADSLHADAALEDVTFEGHVAILAAP